MRNGGDLVVETLQALGISTVFGIPGQHALGLFDALSRSPLRFISSRVENNSAFAADGYARATGEPAALFLSTGPGALTSLAGLEEAYATGVPMVVIASQIPESGLGGRRKGMLHQLDDQKESARNVTKSQATVHKVSAIPYAIEDAWRQAMTAPQGPVWVEIPQDVLLQETTIPAPEDLDTAVPAVCGHAPSLRRAAALLSGAQRPAIIAGGGVRRSAQGSAELLKLADALQSPVICTPGGVGGFPVDHPLSLGSWIEDVAVTELLEDADVLLAVGTSLGEVTSNYFTMAPRGEIIQIDAAYQVLGSNHPGLGIRSDAGLALAAINRLLDPIPDKPHVSGQVAQVKSTIAHRLDQQDLANERAFMAAIRAAVPANMQTFWDMTIAAYWGWNVWDPQEGQFHSAQGAGGIGFGFPAAFGGAIGLGHRVLAVSGDGSAMYSIAELAAAAQHNVPVTWLIIDDGGYGILREYMTDTFGKATHTELHRPDFIALAQAFSIPTRKTDLAGLEESLSEALAANGPNIVVVETLLKMWEPTHLGR
ncbi:thiamine pyrophosphate-binding protein [Corynebacterium lizhenjunii]|uniref:thiamine pyrophosphate-binding protein n=1 Tax=Corynebacterium lizhenjunii TaxID=2709394 RepID=UPI0013ECA955|nr:thiamine pyrophosphate-binding protein [Corynebacterium lizhenjunii]